MIGVEYLLIALLVTIVVWFIIFKLTNKEELQETFLQVKRPWYWTWYNKAEWAWIIIRMMILIPLVIFQNNIWQLYWLGLIAATVLTWTSIRKKLPEFVVYYSFWIWLASAILLSHTFK